MMTLSETLFASAVASFFTHLAVHPLDLLVTRY